MATIRKINYAAIADLSKKLANNSSNFGVELSQIERSFNTLNQRTEGADKQVYADSSNIIKKVGNQTKDEFDKMIRFLKSLDNAKVSRNGTSQTSGYTPKNGTETTPSATPSSGTPSATPSSGTPAVTPSGTSSANNLSESDKIIAEKFKLEKDKADFAKKEADFYKNKLLEKEKNPDDYDPQRDRYDPRRDRYDPRYRDYDRMRDDDYGYGRGRYGDSINDEIDQRLDRLNKLKDDVSSKIGELNSASSNQAHEAAPSASQPVGATQGQPQAPVQSLPQGPKPLGNEANMSNMPFGQNPDGSLKSMSTDSLDKGYGFNDQTGPSDTKIGGESKDISDLDSMSDGELEAADNFDLSGLSQNVDPSKTDFASPVDGVQPDTSDSSSTLRTAGLGALGLGALAAGGAAFYASRKKKKDDNELDTNDEFSNEYKINKDDLDASNFTSW